MKKIIKILLIILGSIFGLLLFVLVGLNLAKFAIYNEFYDYANDVCKNPGLNEGFIPQGIAVSDKEDLILTSGYMNDKSASRIYITNTKNEARYIKLLKNNEAFTGHVGGIALSNEDVYLSNGKRVYKIALNDLLNANNSIEIGEGVKVNNNASFIFADDNYVYVGEFHDGGKYKTNHEIATSDGMNYAICTMYDKNDLSKPLRIYSITNNVQGFCVTKNGTIVLSTSMGITSSKYYIYESDKIKQTGEYEDVPLYILDDYSNIISGPAMSEDLSYANDKVYCLTESACDKYIYGKFFFAYEIYTLDIN